MTLLKRNLCYANGIIAQDDIDSSFLIPEECKVPLTIELHPHGVIDGHAWIEERHTTRIPWMLVFLLFWMIKPTITKYVVVHLEQEEMRIDFKFVMNESETIYDNLYHAPESLSIKQVWFHQT